MPNHTVYRRFVKSALDRIAAAIGLVVCAPLLAAIAVAVRLLLGSPIIFMQLRPGISGRPFRCFKFRTMTDACDPSGVLLPDADRLTPFGVWLRSTSLDELPELWNVLRGEMSLVGPRPLRIEYLDRYTADQMRRHDVKPGITGLAQINGRNAISWSQRFAYDLQYVERLSFWLDLTILGKTIVCVFRRDGVSTQSNGTMPFFTGKKTDEQHTPRAA